MRPVHLGGMEHVAGIRGNFEILKDADLTALSTEKSC